MDNAEGSPSDELHPLEIHAFSRAVAAALGISGLGSGAYAVFDTHLEAGPVALLVVGVIFLVIAMAGVMPWRIKAGDYEIELRKENRVLKGATLRMTAAANPEDPAAKETIRDLERTIPDVGIAARAALGYNEKVHQALERIAVDLDATYEHPTRLERAGLRFDGLLTPRDGGFGVLVTIKASTNNVGRMWANVFWEGFEISKPDYNVRSLLFISGQPLPNDIFHELLMKPGFVGVVYENETAIRELATATRAALSPHRWHPQ